MSGPLRHVLSTLLLVAVSAVPALAAPAARHALIIGNGNYAASPLANPVNDARDFGAALRELGFSVTVRTDAGLQEMEEALYAFGEQLKGGGVGLFFYAGHGIQIAGRNYLVPIDAKLRKETDAKYQALDTEMIIDEMANAGNPVNIVILDACRDNPFGRSFRSASRGLTITSAAPRGTLITYSTSPGKVAADGSGRNSPYTAALLENIRTPGLTVEEVFKKVRQDLGRKTGGEQIPWELSSLEGDFYFRPEKGGAVPAVTAAPAAPTGDYAAERQRMEEERQKLQREKELLEEKKALIEEERRLAEERRRLEEQRQRLAAATTPAPAAIGTRSIPRLDARVSEVRFFEGPYEQTPRNERVYRKKFSRTASRYITWELNLAHPAPGKRTHFDVDAIWYGTNGAEIFRQTNPTYVDNDWTTSWHNMGYGWREYGSNTWQKGSYRVELYVDGEMVASESFEMY